MTFQYEKDDQNIVTVTMDTPGRSQNVINEEFGRGMEEAWARLEKEEPLAGVIITSAKKDFLAGADLNELVKLEDPRQAFDDSEAMNAALRRLETLGKPVVAAISGAALGGGLELALACHHRIAVDDRAVKIGSPEVTLGLVPGAGGVARLTRLIGLQAALPYLTEGRQVDAKTALKAGIIHELAGDGAELIEMARRWILANPEASQPWDQRGFRMPGGDPRTPRVAQVLAIAPAMLQQKTRGNYPAPLAILSAAVEGAVVDLETACRIESRYFANTATGKVAKNMIRALWFQLNAVNSGKNRPGGIAPIDTRKVGVLGAGLMGHGIAYVTAAAGMEAVLKDVSEEKANEGKARIASRLDKSIARGRMTAERKQAILDRVHPTGSVEALQGCDLIVEAVFEDRELKASVTRETEALIGQDAVFGTNTSTLPITGLAAASSRPGNFIGIHFFSPVDRMRLVEIIRGEQTSDRTLAKVFDYVRKIGKSPIVVRDSRGFYTSRVFGTYPGEGTALLFEGQHPRAIESAGLKAGMPVGPLALSDEVGLALMMHIRDQTRRDLAAEGVELDEPEHSGVLDIMVTDNGRGGRTAGGGFYEYPPGDKKFLWPRLRALFPARGEELSQQEMIERMMFIQAIEAARCFGEGVVTSVADANIGSILGWGFAPFKGGALQYINDYGVAAFVERSRELAVNYGKRFSPPEILVRMAQKGETFRG